MTGEVRIKTTTLNEVKRYFLFVFSCLLYNLWKFVILFLEIKVAFATFVFIAFNFITTKLQKKKKEPPNYIKQLQTMVEEHFS